jgi:hypothetical protein
MFTFELNLKKPRNLVSKDLRSNKYRMRVELSKKQYNRQSVKEQLKRELAYESFGV